MIEIGRYAFELACGGENWWLGALPQAPGWGIASFLVVIASIMAQIEPIIAVIASIIAGIA
ncbi:hypothetical protein [Mesobacillus campisalis]|uniref:hypothetical protein n=1 Tax=Mesobacillus campisalis TaxID=1408103 RepID=UPI0012E2F9E3|nr:hypothetical protein [Mesobacillus campisalis]